MWTRTYKKVHPSTFSFFYFSLLQTSRSVHSSYSHSSPSLFLSPLLPSVSPTQRSTMGNPFSDFTGLERRNLIIYVVGIMLYKFGLVRHPSQPPPLFPSYSAPPQHNSFEALFFDGRQLHRSVDSTSPANYFSITNRKFLTILKTPIGSIHRLHHFAGH